MTAKPTAREQIATAAAANGWTLKTPADHERVMNIAEYKKGRKYVRVQFTVHGSVVAASSDNRNMLGTGKLTQVLERLAKNSQPAPALQIPEEPEDFSTYDGPHAVHLGSLIQRGMTAFCVCGWHPKNHPGFVVADHLKDMGVNA